MDDKDLAESVRIAEAVSKKCQHVAIRGMEGDIRVWVDGEEVKEGSDFVVVDRTAGTIQLGSGLPAKPMIDRAFGNS